MEELDCTEADRECPPPSPIIIPFFSPSTAPAPTLDCKYDFSARRGPASVWTDRTGVLGPGMIKESGRGTGERAIGKEA
jgi:hypothetical protein